MNDRNTCELKITILLSNGNMVVGDYDFSSHKFVIPKTVIFEDSFYQALSVVNITNDSATISYMFSSDYLATKFLVKEDDPAEIVDYVSLINPKLDNTRVKIIIELIKQQTQGGSKYESERDFS